MHVEKIYLTKELQPISSPSKFPFHVGKSVSVLAHVTLPTAHLPSNFDTLGLPDMKQTSWLRQCAAAEKQANKLDQ